MTPQARFRRIGWFALLGVCTLLYGLLHLQVWSVSSEVKRAERHIVALEQHKMILETEFLTRSSQAQLAAWNRVDFGYSAPRADQFIGSERQLASFGMDGAVGHDEVLRLASFSADEEVEPFPRLVSPITGEPLDEDLVRPARADGNGQASVIAAVAQGAARVPLAASARPGGAATVRVMLGGAGN
jgi:hypothetical protein